MKIHNFRTNQQGFTLVEMLSVVIAISILVGVMFVTIIQTSGNVRNVKLKNDVNALNKTVQVYLANGGSMEGIGTIGAVLFKLKTTADEDSGAKLVGLKDSMLDPRYEAELMSFSEASSSKPRALWSSDRQRFIYANSGAGGAKRFFIDEHASVSDALKEARKTALDYGTQTGWVWDYTDSSLPSSNGVKAHSDPGIQLTGNTAPSGSTTLTPPTAARLAPPTFSIEAGVYNYFDFDLEVELGNPNPTGVSNLYYALNDGQWNVYMGNPILVAPGQTLNAYAVSLDRNSYADSAHVSAQYTSSFTTANDVGDEPPTPNPDGEVETSSSFSNAVQFTVLASTGVTFTDAEIKGAVEGAVGITSGGGFTMTDSTIEGELHSYGSAVTLTRSWVDGDVTADVNGPFTMTDSSISGVVSGDDVDTAPNAYQTFLDGYDAIAAEPGEIDLTGQSLAGKSLPPGVYYFNAAVAETGGLLTLDGDWNDSWLFKIGTGGTGALTFTNFNVVMADGEIYDDQVIWWTAEAATLTDSTFIGTIYAGTSATVTRGFLKGKVFGKSAVTITGPVRAHASKMRSGTN
ncbi:MAG: prepilin-type N-terminal cleavage/methylation domain-containing protein [Verrucomicrobiales bacterium]|jgi:prepilin-type N-terminal cleavage/methylation domain-containing protein